MIKVFRKPAKKPVIKIEIPTKHMNDGFVFTVGTDDDFFAFFNAPTMARGGRWLCKQTLENLREGLNLLLDGEK